MAINDALQGMRDSLLSLARWNGLAAPAAEAESEMGLGNASTLINNARETALSQARAVAEQEGRAPNLTDYWHAAMLQPELQQNPRMVADLSGLTLDGFVIRAEDLTPNAQTRAVMGDLYDLDGDGQINAEAVDNFFREARTHMNFNNVQFHNVTFQPATTLEIFAHAQGAQFANIILDGLGAGENLTIGTSGQPGANRESYSNVRVINDQGGIIHVNSNATVNGLFLENGNTVLEVAPGGRVNSLNVNSETVSLSMRSNGELFLPSFDNANFTPASSLSGAIIRGNPMDASFHGFRHSNLNGLNFENANISGIDFKSCNLSEACFTGARLSSVTFSSDMDLSAANFSGLRHAHNVQILDTEGHVRLTLNSADEFRSYIASGQQLESPTIAPANRAEEVARSLNLAWNGSYNNYQNDNGQSQGVRFQQVNTLAGLQGVAGMAVPSADAPARTLEGGDIPADATPAQRIAAIGGALTQNFGQTAVNATLNDVTLANQKALDSQEAVAARNEILANAAMESFVSRS